MNIKEMIDKIKGFDNCIIHPSIGLPKIEDPHILPDDVKEFYELCGGIELFKDEDFGVDIVSPNTDLMNRLIETKGEGITWYWYEEDFESLGDAYDGTD
ncbi:hypothetical protein AB432_022900 [Brevibacillus brevis]|uniref:SMI1/KNR4 family protein n=1 Tax=Brevibacillus brevis TaxID=1393 RepID=A0A2Z4MMQ0_BREBE|nr:hypothetical protein [Brevibacillus brevis]AWX57709.1 hypothetical protein AB432_022900 [Brevibacillus brevis]